MSVRNSPQFQNLIAAGVVPPRPYRVHVPRGRPKPVKADATTSSPLSTIFPTTRSIGPVGFQVISLPLAFQTTFGLASADVGSILLHNLCDIEPAAIFGAECSLYGALIHLSSPAKTLAPVDRPNEVLWSIPQAGTTTVNTSSFAGNRALIAIGDDKALPLGPSAHNRWSFMPTNTLPVPGLFDDTIVNGNFEVVDNSRSQFIHYEFFPAGNYWATTCQRATLRPIFSPYVHRFPRGRRLRVSFIITNDNIQPVAEVNDLFVYGGVAISLIMGEMQSQIPYAAD